MLHKHRTCIQLFINTHNTCSVVCFFLRICCKQRQQDGDDNMVDVHIGNTVHPLCNRLIQYVAVELFPIAWSGGTLNPRWISKSPSWIFPPSLGWTFERWWFMKWFINYVKFVYKYYLDGRCKIETDFL